MNDEPASGGRADHLRAQRWAKGTSGNPGGRPRGRSFRAVLRRVLSEKHNGKSRLELLGEVLLREALKGRPAAIKELLDRLEGRPADPEQQGPAPTVVNFNIVEAQAPPPPPAPLLPPGGDERENVRVIDPARGQARGREQRGPGRGSAAMARLFAGGGPWGRGAGR